MGKLLLLSIMLLISSSMLLISAAVVTAHWDNPNPVGPIKVGDHECLSDSGCLTPGWYCFNFQCFSCPGGCAACQSFVSGGGCGCTAVNEGGSCDGAGYFCSSGNCINCQPVGGACASDANCCAGNKCDVSNSKCVTCDANHVQNNPPVANGGGKCEASCGASSQCDELAPGTFVLGGVCNSQCQFVDGDASQAACDSAVGPGNWNLGGEAAQTTCCGDDGGEFKRWKECAVGVCLDNLADDACCNAATKCVSGSTCFYDINVAIAGTAVANTAFCTSLTSQADCTSTTGDASVKCKLDVASTKCVAADTRAAAQYTESKGGSFAAYADVTTDGHQEVCIAASPGKWNFAFGTITGVVTNLTGTLPGATVTVLGTGLSATTAADGSYTIPNVPTGTYDVVAAKSEYVASIVSGVSLFDGQIVPVNFLVLLPLSGGEVDCDDDCTTVGSNLCDANCHGKGLCWFYSDATKQACDGTFGLIEMPDGLMNVDCCKGKPYSPIKASFTVPSKDVIVTKIPVLYHGKFVNMVMVVFNR